MIIEILLLALAAIFLFLGLSSHIKANKATKKKGAERLSKYEYHQKTKKSFVFYVIAVILAAVYLIVFL
jgi:Ca2+/Na+ antiporter